MFLRFLLIFFFQSTPSYADLTKLQLIESMEDEISKDKKKLNELKSLLKSYKRQKESYLHNKQMHLFQKRDKHNW